MGAGFEISVSDVVRVAGQLERLFSDFDGSTMDLGRLMIPSGCYGQVGSTAAASSASAQNQLALTLKALSTVLREINRRVQASAQGYHADDQRIAAVWAQMSRVADDERGVLSRSIGG
ncbi:hypothetical protein [Mangrovihabitans endophyticus]|uniref:WXG100 family type VII secretion target n=1 Tax=Mangrovihabitans endophyticus TaxID=1751298 RepID=A0A8J3BTQ9_9ACTN|nr:hypothetical protein [Mangrovihabitans endophyticus]GGK77586.1 hypothetical protein GCM10012284_09460 [Mangrovihabitans endophyticus]